MPSTPISCSALFTASSLEFWMTASPFVMIVLHSDFPPRCGACEILRRCLPVITFLAVLRQVQPLNLLLLGDAQPNRHIHEFQNCERPHDSNHPRNRDSYELVQHLMGISFEQARRQRVSLRVFEDRIYRAGCEDPG